MNLFVVFYILGVSIASVGPLPYDMVECQKRVLEVTPKVDPNMPVPGGYKLKDLNIICEFHHDRPSIKDPPKKL